MYILDGNLYDSKFLEGGSKALVEAAGTEAIEELEACALLQNKKKVRFSHAVSREFSLNARCARDDDHSEASWKSDALHYL